MPDTPDQSEVTRMLEAAAGGDQVAASRLLPLVYDELRTLARARLSHEKPGLTLQATALVHEAYVRLVGPEGESVWNSRNHFFAAAGIAMRRILVERARAYAGPKRGGGRERLELHESAAISEPESPHPIDWERLDAALTDLEAEEPRIAQVVNLRYFAGLDFDSVARVLSISSRTAKRDWEYAKAWLYDRLSDGTTGEDRVA